MIGEVRAAIDRLQGGAVAALLGRFEPARVIMTPSAPLEGHEALVGHPPLTECVADHAMAGLDLATLLETGTLRGWLTCQSRACPIEGEWQWRPGWGLVLNAELALDDRIGLQIRHLGHQRWRVAVIAEPLTATGEAALAEDVAFLRADPERDDLMLTYRRYWSFTPDGEAVTLASRLTGITQREKA